MLPKYRWRYGALQGPRSQDPGRVLVKRRTGVDNNEPCWPTDREPAALRTLILKRLHSLRGPQRARPLALIAFELVGHPEPRMAERALIAVEVSYADLERLADATWLRTAGRAEPPSPRNGASVSYKLYLRNSRHERNSSCRPPRDHGQRPQVYQTKRRPTKRF